MAIYFILLFLVFLLSTYRFGNRRFSYIVLFILLVFIGAFRDISVGTDTSGAYFYTWRVITIDSKSWNQFSEMEPGFNYLMAFFKTYIIDSYYAFYSFIFLITMLGYNIIIRKFCYAPILCLFFFIIFLYYTKSFNIIRQCLALSLTAPLIVFVTEKRRYSLFFFYSYLLCLSLLIHSSILIFAIVPFVFRIKSLENLFYGKTGTIILLLSYGVCIIAERFLIYIPEVSLALSFMGDKTTNYILASQQEINTISLLSNFLHTCIGILFTLIYQKNNKDDIFYICFILGLIVQNIFGAFHPLFIRIGGNLLFFQIILFANLWYRNEIKNIKYYKPIILFYGLFLFINAMLKNYGDVVPYKTYLT